MSWLPTAPDATANWAEVAQYLLGVVKGAGKTITGKEGLPATARSRREASLERLRAVDTGEWRKGPSTELLWTAEIVLSYPGRQRDGGAAEDLADAQGVAEALTTGNPGTGWRIHVREVDWQSNTVDVASVRLTVDLRCVWRHGSPQGLSPSSAEATANGGLP